jgi:hypothetical protein
MKAKRNLIQIFLLVALLLALPAVAQAQFTFTTNDNALTITGYTGAGGALIIPSSTNGYPVISMGEDAFYNAGLTSLTIPSGGIIRSFSTGSAQCNCPCP